MVTYLGMFSKTGNIVAGTRTTSRLLYVSKAPLGQIVNVPVIKSDTEFLFLKEEGFGTLSSVFSESRLYVATVSVGVITKNIDLGMSTIGIGYEPGATSPVDKSLRRWPRDWHGDNMNG